MFDNICNCTYDFLHEGFEISVEYPFRISIETALSMISRNLLVADYMIIFNLDEWIYGLVWMYQFFLSFFWIIEN